MYGIDGRFWTISLSGLYRELRGLYPRALYQAFASAGINQLPPSYVSVCLCDCYTPVLYRNGYTDQAVILVIFIHHTGFPATLRFRDIKVFPKKTLYQTVDLENLAATAR